MKINSNRASIVTGKVAFYPAVPEIVDEFTVPTEHYYKL